MPAEQTRERNSLLAKFLRHAGLFPNLPGHAPKIATDYRANDRFSVISPEHFFTDLTDLMRRSATDLAATILRLRPETIVL